MKFPYIAELRNKIDFLRIDFDFKPGFSGLFLFEENWK